ncbi:MAG: hypothetical protein AAF497_08075 [Planctomycetota bacterium]
MLAKLRNLFGTDSRDSSETAISFDGIERLESRQMMAGNVSLVLSPTGNLTINGDNLDNELFIEGIGRRKIEVTGGDGTQISFEGRSADRHVLSISSPAWELDRTNLTGNLRIDLRGGNDNVHINNVNVEGNVVSSMGAGDDQLQLNSVQVDRGLTFLGGAGSNRDGLFVLNSSVGGHTRSVLGGSNTHDNFVSTNSTFAGNLVVSQTSGEASVVLYESVVGGRTNVATGSGTDNVTVMSSTVAATSISMGSGIDRLDILGTELDGAANFNLGIGNDETSITSSDFVSSLLLNLGSGNDSAQFDDAMTARTFRILAGSGDDYLEIDDHDFRSSFYVSFGAGDDELDFDGASATVSSVRVVGGAGYDVVHDTARLSTSTLPSYTSIEWTTDF